jgi:hypothetical protein
MAIRVTMTIALRDRGGLEFATLTKVSERYLQVESEHHYPQGRMVEFQFGLEGRRTSIQGEGLVARVEPLSAPRGAQRYAIRIVTLAPPVAERYGAWLRELAHGGGSSARPHRDHASSISHASASCRGDVSDIMGSSATDARPGVGRGAVRQALRGFAVRGEERAVEPLMGEPSAFDSLPAWDTDGTPTEGRGRPRRVSWTLARHHDPPRLELRFADPRRYLAMYREHLDRDVLFLRLEDPPLRVDSRVKVRVVLPSEAVVLCGAHVAAVLPSGTALLLRLNAEERDTLLREARGVRRGR